MKLSLAVALAVLVSALAYSAAQNGAETARFAITPLDLPRGENALHLADFNGDGALDLLSAAESDSALSIRLGDGKANFAPADHHQLGEWPTSIDSADLNGDGRLDLAVAHHEQSFFSVVLGDGEGGVAGIERLALPPDIAPHAHVVRAADIDGDGAPDLIFDSRDRHGLFVLLNVPGAELEFRPVAVDVRGAPYLGFALGDVNGDSRPDIATPNSANVSLLVNDGSPGARFTLAQQVATRSPFAATLADLDRDGRAELIVASEDAAAGISVFGSDGTGSFGSQATARYEMAGGAKILALGDIDGDDCVDVVATAWGGDIAVVRGCSDRTDAVRPGLTGLAAPWSIAVGDLDGDGRDEFIVADGESGRANLYAWNGS
jgi:hypothetical protein